MTTTTLPLPPLEVVAWLIHDGSYSWPDMSPPLPGGLPRTPLVRLSDAQASIEEERAGRAIERELAEARANDAADLAVKLSAAQASLEALQAEMGELRRIGTLLANVAFNWAQHCGHTLTSDDCSMLDKLRKQWDAAVRKVAAIDQAASAGKESEG